MFASATDPLYEVAVMDAAGRVSTIRIAAASPEQAGQAASGSGQSVVHCMPVGRPFKLRHWLPFLAGANGARTLDNAAFSQDLATLLQAGVTVKEAVAALAARESSATKRRLLEQVETAMSSGLSFSAALSQAGAFPELLIATVAASEQTGDLALGLARYAQHHQSLRTVRDRVVGACVYPALLLAVGSAVLMLLLGVVVPRFAGLITSQNRELPLLSKLLMEWGQFVAQHPAVPALLFLALALAGSWVGVQARDPQQRRKWLARIPGVTKLAREFQHLQMYRTTAILTARGIAVHKALAFSRDLLAPADRQRLESGLVRMHEGMPMSAALSGVGLSDTIATSMLCVAERSGAMPEMLDRIADFYERGLQRNIEIVSRLIEPVLMIIFGVLIGGIVILMYLPIFDLASSIS